MVRCVRAELLLMTLTFAGEVVDVDGKCGGYNLQWAWSSAYLAAAGVKERINN